MPDRCTPGHERTIAKIGSLLPYRRARTLLAELLPLGKPQALETTRQRTLRVGTRLEQEAVAGAGSKPSVATKSIALSIDAATCGRLVSIRGARSRFSSLRSATMRGSGSYSPACRRRRLRRRLRGVLHGLGATPATPVTILSDGADGPRSLGEAASLGDLDTYVSGQSDITIDYATARRCEEPISTAITESTVQWLLHRRMNAQQQMRWSPRGAHLMLKVRTAVMNGTLDRDYAIAERWARRPFWRAA